MGTIEMGNLISKQLYVSKPEMKETTITNPTSDDDLLEGEVKNVEGHEDAPNDHLESQNFLRKMTNRALSITDSIKKIQLSGRLSISGRVTKYDGHFIECDGFPNA